MIRCAVKRALITFIDFTVSDLGETKGGLGY